MRPRLFTKLLLAFLLVTAAGTLLLDFGVRGAWRTGLTNEIRRTVETNARQLAISVDQLSSGGPVHASAQLADLVKQHAKATGSRATVIDAQGVPLADSEADPLKMENHATRPEFKIALQGGEGSDTRTSATVGVPYFYVAVPVQGGAVRIAYPMAIVEQALADVRQNILMYSVLALLLAAIMAAWIAHSLTQRIQRIVDFAGRIATGDFKARIDERSSDELAQMATALDATAHRIEDIFLELDQNRRQLETLLESLQEPVIAVDAARRVQWANGRMNALLPTGVHSGAPLVEHLRDPEVIRAVTETIENKDVRTARVEMTSPRRIFRLTAAPLPAGGAVAVLHEITEIERVEKTRRDFIANVSHELRTPLTSIQGYTETLLDTAPEGSQREFLEIIRKHALRMHRLTEDLLTLARVESGEERFDLQPIAAADLVREAQESFLDAAQRSGHPLNSEDLSEQRVIADKDKVHQVFANLIENALKYAPHGTRLTLGARANGDHHVEFYVRDEGPGIASEHQPRLFERFYRVDKARSVDTGGTGLGLAIAKHIVLKHGGVIHVESELGKGATFVFTIPMDVDHTSGG